MAEPELVAVKAWLAELVIEAVGDSVRVTDVEEDAVELGVKDCEGLWLNDWLFVEACDCVGVPDTDPVDTGDALDVWDGDCVKDLVPVDDRVTTRL